MNEIAKYFFGLSGSSERKARAIALKSLYYLNCTVITIWLADLMNYKGEFIITEIREIPRLFTEYSIVVPIFTFLFVTFSCYLLVELISFLSYRLCRGLSSTFIEQKNLEALLVDLEIMDEAFQPKVNYHKAVKRLQSHAAKVDSGTIMVQYYLSLLITIIVIYRFIVYEEFPNLYFSIAFAAILAWLGIMIMVMGMVKYLDARIHHTLDVLYGSITDLKGNDEQKKIRLKEFLGLGFPKSKTLPHS